MLRSVSAQFLESRMTPGTESWCVDSLLRDGGRGGGREANGVIRIKFKVTITNNRKPFRLSNLSEMTYSNVSLYGGILLGDKT